MRKILSSRPDPTPPPPAGPHHDYIIAQSPLCSGFCVYDQVAYGDYDLVAGPFSYEEAEAALEELLSEQ